MLIFTYNQSNKPTMENNTESNTSEFIMAHWSALDSTSIERYFSDRSEALIQQLADDSDQLPIQAETNDKLDADIMHDMLCKDIAFTRDRIRAYSSILETDLEYYIRKILISDLADAKKRLIMLVDQMHS